MVVVVMATRVRWGRVRWLGRAYAESMERRPYLTNMVTGACLWTMGDIIAQRLEPSPHEDELAPPATTSLGLAKNDADVRLRLLLCRYAKTQRNAHGANPGKGPFIAGGTRSWTDGWPSSQATLGG